MAEEFAVTRFHGSHHSTLPGNHPQLISIRVVLFSLSGAVIYHFNSWATDKEGKGDNQISNAQSMNGEKERKKIKLILEAMVFDEWQQLDKEEAEGREKKGLVSTKEI